jgi:hypothetical protein
MDMLARLVCRCLRGRQQIIMRLLLGSGFRPGMWGLQVRPDLLADQLGRRVQLVQLVLQALRAGQGRQDGLGPKLQVQRGRRVQQVQHLQLRAQQVGRDLSDQLAQPAGLAQPALQAKHQQLLGQQAGQAL